MEGLELQCFQIISSVGLARSNYIEAMKEAREGNIEKAKEMLRAGEEMFVKGHGAHAELVQQEAAGNALTPTLLLVHAEDQLMSAEGFKIIAEEMIACYETIHELKAKLS